MSNELNEAIEIAGYLVEVEDDDQGLIKKLLGKLEHIQAQCENKKLMADIKMNQKIESELKNALENETHQCDNCSDNSGCKECALWEQKKAIRFRIERNYYRRLL